MSRRKPWECLQELELVVGALRAGQRLDPALSSWFVGALHRRIREPDADLERLLGLRTGRGGRGGGAHSPLPRRDRQIRAAADTIDGATTTAKAREIHRRWLAGELPALGHRVVTVRRIQSILAAK